MYPSYWLVKPDPPPTNVVPLLWLLCVRSVVMGALGQTNDAPVVVHRIINACTPSKPLRHICPICRLISGTAFWFAFNHCFPSNIAQRTMSPRFISDMRRAPSGSAVHTSEPSAVSGSSMTPEIESQPGSDDGPPPLEEMTTDNRPPQTTPVPTRPALRSGRGWDVEQYILFMHEGQPVCIYNILYANG